MKALISTIFGVLVALVIAGGAYIGLRNRRQHLDFLEERRALVTEVEELEGKAAGWNGLPEDFSRIESELDSMRGIVSVIQTQLSERLAARGSLSRTPKLVLGEPQDTAGWRAYPFLLILEGRPEAVDSSMRALQDDLPFMHLQHLDAVLISSRRLKLEITGSVRFPPDPQHRNTHNTRNTRNTPNTPNTVTPRH
ncbi:hypothetical protein KAX06_05460 [candidate division WOR-3 bacterium]|nr:hypothetical protein [candidate division WOR-3 bacterium]